MLKYLIVHLADNAVSYCHYSNTVQNENLISEECLRRAFRYAMLENLYVSLVYPEQSLPSNYSTIIDSIEHTKIVPINSCHASQADIVVADMSCLFKKEILQNKILVLRIASNEIKYISSIYKELKDTVAKINVVLTDIEKCNNDTFEEYKKTLELLIPEVESSIINSDAAQLNILSDRLFLNEMNNCNAGYETITLMPNGKFYPCAGFYMENDGEDYGDLDCGISIKNQQLYKLEFAPICCHCDAYQCRRCAYLNRKMTLEVNTPSHEQCVLSHIERNYSSRMVNNICSKENNNSMSINTISEVDYLDPFDMRENWL